MLSFLILLPLQVPPPTSVVSLLLDLVSLACQTNLPERQSWRLSDSPRQQRVMLKSSVRAIGSFSSATESLTHPKSYFGAPFDASSSTEETAVMPVNMMDWEAHQRARKEQEKKNKAQAAETLHTFRGAGVFEMENNLANLRKEDRQKNLDAETTRHNYRANLEVVGKGMKRSTVPRVSQQVSAATVVDEVIPDISVAALAQVFNKSFQEEELITGNAPFMYIKRDEDSTAQSDVALPNSAPLTQPTEQTNDPKLVTTSSEEGLALDISDQNVCATMEESVLKTLLPLSSPSGMAEKMEESFAEHEVAPPNTLVQETMLPRMDISTFDDGVVVYNPTEDTIQAMVVVESSLADDWVDVQPWESSPAPPIGDDELSNMTTKHSNTLERHVESPIVPLRLDVEFFFALLTEATSPDVDRYMSAFVTVVGQLLKSGTTMGTSGVVSLHPHFAPYIRHVGVDKDYIDVRAHAQSEVKRFVVHASLPVFLAHSTGGGADARNGVLQLLRQVIENGSLLDAVTNTPLW